MKKSKNGAGRRIQYKFNNLLPFESSHCYNYVIELKESVTLDPAFMRKNPGYVSGLCFYVGMTSGDVEERFQQHIQGTKNVSRIAHTFGLRLRMDLVTNREPVRRTWALEREVRITKQLRSQGYGAWMG
jgi:predicted GIY-YIG superfamily endonuclease